MPPRATLAKLKKQMDATHKQAAKRIAEPEFSQSDSLSAMEQRLIALELRLERPTQNEPPPAAAPDLEPRLAATESRLSDMARLMADPAKLEQRLAATESRLSDMARLMADPANLEQRLAAMEMRLGDISRSMESIPSADLQRRLATTEIRLGEMSQAMDAIPAMDMQRRLATIEIRLGEMTKAMDAIPTARLERRLATLETRLDDHLSATITPPSPDAGQEQRIALMERQLEKISQTPPPPPSAPAVMPIMGGPELLIRMWFAPVMFFLSMQEAIKPNKNDRK
ncbi:MAG: hypothetical protein HQL84_07160 [Magnetococcales bacterium]|nr:hypothetical protein [Magnetococcales bacterium]MBF0149809.1 hypothetical protein [Magnetococcales bacterium]MBF0174958.1 hypothetical protein [Magnetococcales bacterium]MBF0630769.1 hypothetical protein [Magnetococcales bacterium]